MAGYGSAAGDGQGQQNPFTPQDFGGSSSDGFDAFDRQQQQQQLGFQGAKKENNKFSNQNFHFPANGDLSFLPRPSSASPLDFHAYGSNGGAYSTVGGDDAAGDDEAAEAADDAEEFTKFPTLIPPQKLAAQGAIGEEFFILYFNFSIFMFDRASDGGGRHRAEPTKLVSTGRWPCHWRN